MTDIYDKSEFQIQSTILSESKEKVMKVINIIEHCQKSIITLNEELEDINYKIQDIVYKEKDIVYPEGKNAEEREKNLFYALDENDDYKHYIKQKRLCKNTIDKRRIELDYFNNLLTAYKLFIRLEYIKSNERND